MPACAFLTTDALDAFVTYDHEAVEPLAALGWTVDVVPWRADADWDAYALVIIRSPWDYQDDPDAFLDVLGRIDQSAARLENGLDVVRWNARKTYLRDLESAGVPIVPTAWERSPSAHTLADALRRWGAAEGVVKPIVGANADGVHRLHRDDGAGFERAAAAYAGSEALVQPFVPAVVSEGEFSVFVFGGAVSHAVLKTPAEGDFRVQEEHGGVIRGVAPEPALLDLTRSALAVVPGGPLLYARADAVRMPDGTFAVMELELIEPSLYFPYGPGSAERFARAVDALARG